MKKIKIWGASTLLHFTSSIIEGFLKEGFYLTSDYEFDLGLAQLHGSPLSKQEDAEILDEVIRQKVVTYVLIHRPDEILENKKIFERLERNDSLNFIFLGDLVFKIPFWAKRRNRCKIIPHPYTDFTLPDLKAKPIIGSFTSWGEMRKLEHFLLLADELKNSDKLQFKIGGSGFNRIEIPDFIEISEKLFYPHFNLQLYHLNGYKRIGESSGSLHRGISIPIIFEANGMEQLEQIKVIKIDSDDELKEINYKKAAKQILDLVDNDLELTLLQNLDSAKKNSSQNFARNFLNLFSVKPN